MPMELIDITTLQPQSQSLDEDLFWSIVAKSLHARTQYEQEALLIFQLARLSPEEMIGFRLRTDKLLYDSYKSHWWCAAYLMNGVCFDDGFEYFRLWVISRGRDVFYRALENPDTLIGQVVDDRYLYEFELFWYVAREAFEYRTGKDLYDYIDDENFKTGEGNYPPIEFDWTSREPETLRAICPQLYKRFGVTGRYRFELSDRNTLL
jgi:hypothetical protein